MPGTSKAKTKNPVTIKNLKLGMQQKDSKIPKKNSTTGTIPNKARSLLRDFHMPPGYKDGK